MIFPNSKEIYEFKGKKYIVLTHTLFITVYVQEVLEHDSPEGSHFYTFNWWSFVFNAKHIGTSKISSAY